MGLGAGQAACPFISFALIFFLIIMLRPLDQPIKHHGDRTQDHNGSDHHAKLEHLRSIDDQISESAPCGQKFSDDDADQSKADIHLHIA